MPLPKESPCVDQLSIATLAMSINHHRHLQSPLYTNACRSSTVIRHPSIQHSSATFLQSSPITVQCCQSLPPSTSLPLPASLLLPLPIPPSSYMSLLLPSLSPLAQPIHANPHFHLLRTKGNWFMLLRILGPN